ncbi:hypothetical protein BDQ12DRAFT_390243 [Crucibulum laeve]|uniref:Uncharacterized protein n=1 Tax=Crucibulum laeve TaxID=68775 RepID=A0A5C3M836_9AGAR|nr:hypothetical protein BDQ12DRAFT_390243 [Crucibulum laeve]
MNTSLIMILPSSNRARLVVIIGASIIAALPILALSTPDSFTTLHRLFDPFRHTRLTTLRPSGVTFPSVFQWLKRLWKGYDTYSSDHEEAHYWKVSARGQRELQHSDARFVGREAQGLPPSVIPYYVPALLPEYREVQTKKKRKTNRDNDEYVINPRKYCKWHRMVFRGPTHPTLSQASFLRMSCTSEDMQEMSRIARMRSDEAVFSSHSRRKWKWTPEYQEIWRNRLTMKKRHLEKERELEVAFE